MGGNALAGKCFTRRFDRDEYMQLETLVVSTLRKNFPNARVEPIPAYSSKETFGDMDVLVYTPTPVDWSKEALRLFSTKGMVKNGNVISFECNEIQVDLIQCTKEELGSSFIYFSYNDLGNFMGRVAHKMGFKYGHLGLVMTFRSGTHQFDEVVVSAEMGKVFEFLGYDFRRFHQGFDTLEDVFKFASSTPYFHKDIFSLHNRNHKAATRDAKRKSYNSFLKWLETADGLPEYKWQTFEERGGTKSNQEFLERAFIFFPEFEAKYNAAMQRLANHEKCKSMFNGNMVSEWTGLSGPQLGKMMVAIYSEMSKTHRTPCDFVLDRGTEVCKLLVVDLYSKQGNADANV